MTNSNLETLLIIFVGLTAIAVLLQAGVLLGILLTMLKAVKFAKQEADEYRGKITPLIQSGSRLIESGEKLVGTGKELIATTTGLVQRLEPQLNTAAAEMTEMAQSLHEQTVRLQAQADEIAYKVRQQSDRVDGMTTSLLNNVDRAGRFLNDAVNAPIRQVHGVVAAAKAVVDTLRAPAPPKSQRIYSEAPTDEKDLFV